MRSWAVVEQERWRREKREARSCYHALINPVPRGRPMRVCVWRECECMHVLRGSALGHVHICAWE